MLGAAEHPLLDHIGQRHGRQKHMDLPAQLFPEIMRDAARRRARAALGASRLAARGRHRLVDRRGTEEAPRLGTASGYLSNEPGFCLAVHFRTEIPLRQFERDLHEGTSPSRVRSRRT